ncbi:MAG: exodeoxyribonuclease VII large subunit [Bradymonadales bacterium]|nr:exodeoxyribonuclease VII large subunit [Bradymonadales bacterium]
MSQRTVTLSPDRTLLFVTSEYNEEIRLVLRSFSGATWNSQRRVWSLPARHSAALLERLAPFDFLVDSEVASAAAPPAAGPSIESAVESVGEPAPLSVSEVTARVGMAIAERFPQAMWVTGELSSFDKGTLRRHLFFELVEKAPGQDEIASRLSAVIFHQQRVIIEERLSRAAQPLELRDGLNVLVHGRLDFYPRTGRLQLIIDNVDPFFTLGDLARRRQEILDRLAREGILQRNLSLPWPVLPLRIGLITGAESDALHDFLQTLRQSGYGFEVQHYPAAVQGPRLEPEMLGALEFFASRAHALDLVAIIRGGGPRSDLAWFDNLKVARMVATLPVKVVVGIGHERDRSVLDEVAESEKTPTALAEMLVNRVAAAESTLDALAQRLIQRTRQRLLLESERHRHQGRRLWAGARQSLEHSRVLIESQYVVAVRQTWTSRVQIERGHLDQLARQIRPPRLRLLLAKVHTSHQERHRKLLHRPPRLLDQGRFRLDSARSRLLALDPARVLARGYAVVRNQEGLLVKHPGAAPLGSPISIRLASGELGARVETHRLGVDPRLTDAPDDSREVDR